MIESHNMLTSFFKNVILISAIIVLVVGYNLWPIAWGEFFYQANAFGYLLLFTLIKYGISGGRIFKVMANIGFWFSVNNLLDELFFDPKKILINEYIFAVIIIITSILISKRNGST